LIEGSPTEKEGIRRKRRVGEVGSVWIRKGIELFRERGRERESSENGKIGLESWKEESWLCVLGGWEVSGVVRVFGGSSFRWWKRKREVSH